MVPVSPSTMRITSLLEIPETAKASNPQSFRIGAKYPPTLESIKVSVKGEMVPTINLPVPGKSGSFPKGPLAMTSMFSGLSYRVCAVVPSHMSFNAYPRPPIYFSLNSGDKDNGEMVWVSKST